MYDIITIGSATRDVFLISENFQIIKSPKSRTGAFECVSLGSKIDVDKMVLTTGGGATNAAATFSSLGYETATISRIGDDPPGQGITHELKESKIKTNLIKTVKGGQTAYSVLLTTPSGERTVLVFRGVSANFTPNDIPWSKLHCRWIYITSLGGNLGLVKKIVNEALRRKIKVAYNPGIGEINQGYKAFEPLLEKLTVLNMNREEASELSGKPIEDINGIMERLCCRGSILVITDGIKGSYARAGDETWFAKPSKVKAVSRTGAGDAFGSGFIASLIKDDDIPKALQVGTLNAESVILSIGAKSGILSRLPTTKTRSKIKILKI